MLNGKEQGQVEGLGFCSKASEMQENRLELNKEW